MTIASGMWKREAGDVLAACDFEVCAAPYSVKRTTEMVHT